MTLDKGSSGAETGNWPNRPGRLLNVHRYHYRKGGAEAVYLDHTKLFRARGWACAEFTMAHPANEPSEWQRYFPSYFEPTGGLRGLTKLPRFFYSPEAKRNIRRLLDDFLPDIVHIHGLYHQLTPSILGPIAQRAIPIVYTLHDFKQLCPAYTLYTEKLGLCERCASGQSWHCVVHSCLHESRAVSTVYAADAMYHRWRGSYKAVGAYVLPSQSILETHRKHGFPSEKLHYIPNFFETTTDAPIEAVQVGQMRARYGNYVLYFGRLSNEKGCAHLIAACDAAKLALVLAGDGPEEFRLKEMAARSSAPVFFTGYLAGETLWALVEGSLGVVLPAIWYEIAPKSVLEALSRGKPVVASAIGGLPELIDDGVTGFLVPPGDSAALAGALARLAGLSAGDRAAMSVAAREQAHSRFSTCKYYSSMVALYSDLLRCRPPAF